MYRVRCLQLEAAFNFRDLGGYPTVDGRTTRWGLVYRSDTLHLLTPGDIEVIADLGIWAIYDLRRQHERTRFPTALPPDHGHRDIHLDVFDDPGAEPGPSRLDLLVGERPIVRDDDHMIGRYVTMLDEGAVVFGRLLSGLAVRDGLPALFHCAAGKDRTGIAAALLLLVLGVDRDTVLDDYDATNTYRTNRYIERIRPNYEEAGIDLEELRPVLRARPQVLDGALRWLAATHDDVETYLTTSAHVRPETLVALRDLLLE